MKRQYMKTFALLCMSGVIIVITSSASLPTTTPLSPSLALLKMKDFYIQRRYHRNDHQVSSAIGVLESWIRVAEIPPIDSQKIHSVLTDFLKDWKNETIIKECGATKVLEYYAFVSDVLAETDGQNAANFFNEFFKDLAEKLYFVRPGDKFEKMYYNDTLRMEIYKHMKFNIVCCKFWNKAAYVDQIIDGEC